MKVAINGAGIAGPSLAFWLARTGHEVTLLEQAPEFRAGGYMIDFWGIGYALAEKMGILPAVLEAGYRVQEVRLLDGHGRKAGGFSTRVFERITDGRFTSLPRGALAATIYAAVEDRIETLFDNGIAAIEEHDNGVGVELARGAPREFDFVVGADGQHSAVRELAFGPQRQFEKLLGYHVAAFELEGYRPRDELVYLAFALPGRQVARFAMRGDRTLVLFVFRSEYLGGAAPDELAGRKDALRAVFGGANWECARILDAMSDVDEIYFDRVSQIRLPAWSRGRTVLIGDAAAAVSLLAGEGTGLAMTEAYVLAGELARATADAGGRRAAFEGYERRLRAFIERKQRGAERFASSFAPRTAIGAWIRNQATKLMGVGPLADRLIGRSLRDDLDLPDYGI